ncbi:MAG: prepilin-type N-terminal cleavage/methylation domain-containing protein [Bacilli bacterium]|nr:prepilin-type N-terminal cleavage/methylation domain-containing protein [Bacilli bacterium]
MKKGFTIMELLVTISLLLLVAVLIVPNIMKMSDSVKQTQYESKLELILTAGEEYGEDNINLLSSTSCTEVNVGTLVSLGYLKGDSDDNLNLIDPRTNESMNNIKLCIKQTRVTYDTGKIDYKIISEFLEEI